MLKNEAMFSGIKINRYFCLLISFNKFCNTKVIHRCLQTLTVAPLMTSSVYLDDNLKTFKDTLETISRSATFLANTSLKITLLVQKPNYMPLKLCYVLAVMFYRLRKEKQEQIAYFL